MANYTQVSYGSQGDEVKKLQEMLNKNGAALDVDGVFGNKTLQAVKDYQTNNNLTSDGVVGDATWSALNGGANDSAANTTDNTQNTTTAPDYSKYTYDASTNTAYMDALAALQQASEMKPTYQASYDSQLQEIYDQIVNRDKFSYNLNEDALYQQYADQYQMMGQQAMMDTMGQAAALTGGYGNSYASTAGNQAYQAYLQQLNDVVPELYGMALDQYNAEGDKLLTQYSMLGDMADKEYSKYMDSLNQYWQSVTNAQQQADNAYSKGYNEWLTAQQMGIDAENTAYTKQQAEYEKLVSMITSLGYAPTDAELAAAGMSKEQYNAYKKYYDKQNTGYYTPKKDTDTTISYGDFMDYGTANRLMEQYGMGGTLFTYDEFMRAQAEDDSYAKDTYEDYLRNSVIMARENYLYGLNK